MVTVGLARAESRYATVTAALEAVREEVNLDGVRLVLVKPNFVTPHNQLAATHVDAVRAVLTFLRSRYEGRIVIGEGAALSPTQESFDNYGYRPLAAEFGVELYDLNGDETVTVTVRDRRMRPLHLRLARLAAEADFRVSVCPPKTHDTVIVTLSIKNIVMGALVNPHASRDAGQGPAMRALRRISHLLPDRVRGSNLAERLKGRLLGGPNGSQKMAMHQGIPVINLNLAMAAPAVWPHLAVIDGWEGMEGAGPGDGDPVPWRVALASTDPLAADWLTARLMGFDPAGIGYLHYCRQMGLGETQGIETAGNLTPEEAARPFLPHPTIAEQQRWQIEHGIQPRT